MQEPQDADLKVDAPEEVKETLYPRVSQLEEANGPSTNATMNIRSKLSVGI